jgi:hypothetical protein
MTADLSIGRAHNRFHLPAGRRDHAARLTRIFDHHVAGEALPTALVSAGLAEDAIVCIRRVQVRCVLPGGDSDAELAARWSAALAAAIVGAMRAGGDNVRVYRSRHAALRDAIVSAVDGQLADAWAWADAGVWPDARWTPPQVTSTRALDALIALPEAAPPILATLAQSDRLDPLLRPALAERWERLLDAVMRRFEYESVVASASDSPGSIAVLRELPLRLGGGAAALWAFAVSPGCPPRIARQLARIAVIAAAPTVPPDRMRAVLAALAALVAPPVLPALRPGSEAPNPEAAGQRLVWPTERNHKPQSSLEPRTEGWPAAAPATTAAGDNARPEPAVTAWGGVPFLIWVLRQIDLPARHQAGALGQLLGGRPLRWLLHELASTLVPLGPDDPAALAFAGLGPRERPPSAGEPPPEPAERAALGELGAELTAALRLRLPDVEGDDDALLAVVCRRQAKVVADAGWIEIHLSHTEVRTDVRRAGLDLDPGWVPFLGVVIRFVYA